MIEFVKQWWFCVSAIPFSHSHRIFHSNSSEYFSSPGEKNIYIVLRYIGKLYIFVS